MTLAEHAAEIPPDPSAAPLVCVVDDDASLLRAMHRLLSVGGFHAVTFDSAEAFLEYPSRARAACLVVDVHLGALSGFDLQARLAASGSRVPILFITACDDVLTRERARRAGAVDYLQKPVDDEVLLGAIQRAIAGR